MKSDSLAFDTKAWLTDAELRCVPPEARGCLIDLMCYAHQGQPYGHVSVSGKPMNDEMIARLLYLPPEEWARIKTILLESHRIYVAEHTGSIYIKRMVRDHEQRMLATEGGMRGGNPQLLDRTDEPRPVKAERAKPITALIYWNRLPAHLQTPEMKDAVNEWHDYRTRRKILLTRESMARQINTLAPLSPDQAVVWIQTAIDRNWRGLYPPPNGSGYARKDTSTTRKQDTHAHAKEFKSNVNPKIIT